MGVTLYTGGCRSGKSRLALELAKETSGNVCFIATCVPQDDEMRLRVKEHQDHRPPGWQLIEEPIAVADAISSVDPSVFPIILVDCLTLWVCNLMCREKNSLNTEEEMAAEDGVEFNAVIKEGVPAEDIIGYASEQGIDLIVMGTAGRTGLDKFLLGSVAEKVVRTAPCPVLIIHK